MAMTTLVKALAVLSALPVSLCYGPFDISVLYGTDPEQNTPVPPASLTATYCGDIITQVDQDKTTVFSAELAFQCLASVPFIDAVALRFIDYYNTTLQFQSTLAYLKNPPSTYQQPAVDVLGVLQQIKENVTAGYYKTQYDFEANVQSLVYQMHDTHAMLNGGILAAFTFGNAYDLMSLSADGKAAPQIYMKQDVFDSKAEGWTPSPVTKINDMDVIEYLKKFAALNSYGSLEPHSDWNSLMYSPIQDVLGTYNIFGWWATFYPGTYATFTFANNTSVDGEWLAFYQESYPTGPLTTAGDFYNYFVLGLLPASFNSTPSSTDSSDISSGDNSTSSDPTNDGFDNSPQSGSWYSSTHAYPESPDIAQPGLALGEGAYLSGYFLNSSNLAVLSIPSFDEYGDSIGSFSNTTGSFISRATTIGLKRVVIDLQGNTGGTPLLAFDMFHQFFPRLAPFAGSRRRTHALGNALGDTMTSFWQSLTPDNTEFDFETYYLGLAANEWVVTDRLNAATGQNFTSWQDYAGPLALRDDYFSKTEQYNLSSIIFDSAAFNGWLPAGFDGPDDVDPPFAPEDIVILTDGACSSTCALFVEMMTHQAGVRTVVVGGIPSAGPMQAVGGTRGAIVYSADALDRNILFARSINATANGTLPEVRESNMWINYATVNLRDQIRANDTVPLQFKYEAANCRIYYTLDNALNYTRLWLDAAQATFDDSSLCVAGSTGQTTAANTTANTNNSTTVNVLDEYDFRVSAHLNSDDDHDNATQTNFDITYSGDMSADLQRAVEQFTKCGTTNCALGCRRTFCPGRTIVVDVCPIPCFTFDGGACGDGITGRGTCRLQSVSETKFTRNSKGQIVPVKTQRTTGVCVPVLASVALGCPGQSSINLPPTGPG